LSKRVLVDAHHHLWDTAALSYPWLTGPPYAPTVAGDVAPIAMPYLVEDFRREASAFDLHKSVHVDGGCTDLLAETRWLETVNSKHGIPNAIVAGARLHEAGFAQDLERQIECPLLRGVRQILNWDPDPLLTFTDRPDYMTDSQWLDGFALLQKHGLNFDLQIYPWQMRDAVKLAERFTGTAIVLNHCGMPFHQRGMGFESWRRGMRELARCDNVSVKISGLGMADWNWTVDSIRPIVLETIEMFGTERCMFASNFPVDRLYSSFETLFHAFETIVRDFSAEQQHALFASNAERIYRI
jgi:predicted TIM-barrel fold metal-dependent hydrolase